LSGDPAKKSRKAKEAESYQFPCHFYTLVLHISFLERAPVVFIFLSLFIFFITSSYFFLLLLTSSYFFLLLIISYYFFITPLFSFGNQSCKGGQHILAVGGKL
jgi:hypothetical protein